MSLVRRLTLAATLAVVAATARAYAEEPARPAWADDLAALRLEGDPAKRVERTWALLAKKPDVAALRAELARLPAWKADEAKGSVVDWKRDAGKAGKLTVSAYVPAAYTIEKAWPVLLWLHGAVARDEDGGGEQMVEVLRDAGEMSGCIVLAPSGTKDTMWWSPAGVAHVRGSLADLARRYRVDPDRVAAAGFSDGGSGCYHLLAHDPDPYACFLAAMGHPLVGYRLSACQPIPCLESNKAPIG
jgi:poly(3-hydroxybutyrate) depolymerase